MPGPPPKDPKIRQRRNKVSTSATLTRSSPPRQRAPSLPKRYNENGKRIPWHALTVDWWRDVWHSPMAGQFLEVDKHALYRLAALVDRFWCVPSKELAAEIRLEQQAFGLTPLDRRRLQWTVEAEEAPRRPRRQAASADGEAEDPRNILKMVASR